MSGFSLKRRWRFIASAMMVTVATACCPTPASAQASIRFSPPRTSYWGPTGDGSALIGVEGDFPLIAFIERNGVKTYLTMGGLFGLVGGMTLDGSTVVGIEYDETFTPYAWIWHEGEEEVSPLLQAVPVSFITISSNGLVMMGEMPVPGTFDAQGFVIREGVFSELNYPGAITTTTRGMSADGSVISGTAYVPNARFNLDILAVVWQADGSSTLVPLPPGSLQSIGGGVSQDGTTVFGSADYRISSTSTVSIATLWKVGEPIASTIYLGGDQVTYINSISADGSTAVGGGSISSNVFRGFVWRNGTIEILEPKAGWLNSQAAANTPDGYRIVGESWGPTPSDLGNREVTIWDGNRPPALLRDMLAAKGVTVGSPRLDVLFGLSFDGSVMVGSSRDLSAPPENQFATFVAVLPVPTPAELIQDLIGKVQGLGIQHGIENSLVVKLNAAIAALNQGDVATAVSKLNDFIDQVSAQSGNHIPSAVADELIADAQEILDRLGD